MPRKGKGSRRRQQSRPAGGAGAILGAVPIGTHVVRIPAIPRWSFTRTRLAQSTANTWDLGSVTGALAVTTSLQSVQSCPEWTAFSSVYDQFRVRGVEVKIPFPTLAAWAAAGATGFPTHVVCAYDNDQYATTKTYSAIIQYGSHVTAVIDGMLSFRMPVLPKHMVQPGVGDGVFESSWIDVASYASLMGQIMFSAPALLTGINTWTMPMVVDYDVEFRARQ